MIGIIGAMESEISILKDKLQCKKEKEIASFTFYEGKLENKDVVILKCGVGKVAAAIGEALLINNYNPKVIINTGIAGGKNIERHSITLPKEFYYNDVDVQAFGYKIGQMPGCPQYFEADLKYFDLLKKALSGMNLKYEVVKALSGDSFINKKEQLKYDLDGKVIYEMEGASLAHTAYRLNTPFVAVRFVSDIIDSKNQLDDYNEFERNAASISNDIIINIVKVL